jgi:hypothetical protein
MLVTEFVPTRSTLNIRSEYTVTLLSIAVDACSVGINFIEPVPLTLTCPLVITVAYLAVVVEFTAVNNVIAPPVLLDWLALEEAPKTVEDDVC